MRMMVWSQKYLSVLEIEIDNQVQIKNASWVPERGDSPKLILTSAQVSGDKGPRAVARLMAAERK